MPIKRAAQSLGLSVHQIDTFKDWNPPNPLNLVIAVSFGLLFPARILRVAEYGGLNVHPSLLPDLRGPAPLHHAILKRRTLTGVSLQTMHPTKFDHGDVLAQGPGQGVPISNSTTPQQLLEILGPLGAEMLTEAIEQGIFVPPVRDILKRRPEPEDLAHAPKITPEDRRIDWETWDAEEIKLRDRVFGGRLWDTTTYERSRQSDSNKQDIDTEDGSRTIFNGPWRTEPNSEHAKPELIAPRTGSAPCNKWDDNEDRRQIFNEGFDEDYDTSGQTVPLLDPKNIAGVPFAFRNPESKEPELRLGTRKGELVVPASVTIEGGSKGGGSQVLIKMLEEAQQRFDQQSFDQHIKQRQVKRALWASCLALCSVGCSGLWLFYCWREIKREAERHAPGQEGLEKRQTEDEKRMDRFDQACRVAMLVGSVVCLAALC